MEMTENSAVNFSTTETSANSTIYSFGIIRSLDICVKSFNLLLGLPTHFCVVWLIITDTGSRIPSEFFILNLAVCEIINCLNCLIFILRNWFPSLLKLAHFLTGLGITGRPVFECLICVERYLAVVHPVTFLKFKPLRYRAICCAAAWILSLGSCVACSFFAGTQDSLGYSMFFSIHYLLFLSVQLFCCVAVLRALKQSGPGERGREREEENHIKRRAFYLILITTVNTVTVYTPIIMTGVCFALIQQNTKALWLPSSVFYSLAGFVQSGLYLQRVGKLSCLCFSKNRG